MAWVDSSKEIKELKGTCVTLKTAEPKTAGLGGESRVQKSPVVAKGSQGDTHDAEPGEGLGPLGFWVEDLGFRVSV